MENRKKDGKKERKRGLPVTGILVGVVAVLAVCLAIVVWLVLGTENSSKNGRQDSGKNEKEERLMETSKDVPIEGDDGKDETPRSIRPGEPETEEGETESDETDAKSGVTGTEKDETERKTDEKETEMTRQEESGSEPGESESEESPAESETEPEEKLVVAIDPGHQGSWVNMSDTEPNGPGSSEMKAKATTGTQGPYSGKAEYELNLEISLLLRTELEQRGYEVILTREDHDAAISNSERALMAYDQGGDIYVRIHANGSDDSGVQGALAMVPSSSNPYVGHLAADSYTLAECILNHYCETASFQSLGIQYYDNMTGINWSKLPVMILEMGFMTNQSDDLRMADTAVQKLMASGIADGIDEYFTKKGMKKKEVAPEAAARMGTLLERLGEDYLYPAMDQGESWAVSVKNLDTEAEGDINGDVQMASASVIKVFLMAAIYDRVCYPASEERRISIEETYDGELKQLITDMITVSDNDAANTLLERLGQGDSQAGMAVVNQFCRENGYTSTVMGRRFLEQNPSGDNFTSANDCRRLLETICRGTCVGPEASAKMYAYLEQQTRTNKIPAGLTGSALAANKTGELAGDYGQYVENDIAVVEEGDSAYILCVLSQNLKDNGEAIRRIGKIAKAVQEGR